LAMPAPEGSWTVPCTLLVNWAKALAAESRTKRAKPIAGRLPGMVPPKLALRRRKRFEKTFTKRG
jgi:hypothetical protein